MTRTLSSPAIPALAFAAGVLASILFDLASTEAAVLALGAAVTLGLVLLRRPGRGTSPEPPDERLDAALATVPLVVYRGLVTPDGEFRRTYLSRGIERLTGWPWAVIDAPGGLRGILDRTGHPAEAADMRRLLREDEIQDTFRLRCADGGFREVHATVFVERRLPDGTAEVAGFMVDASAVRAAEASQAASEARLRLAQSAAGFGVHDHDLATGVLTWDARMHALWGIPAGVAVDRRLYLSCIHPDDQAARRAATRAALRLGVPRPFTVEYRVIGLADGIERWIASTFMVHFDGRRPVRVVGVAVDISDRRQAEQRNELLVREVDHRAKNALAVVLAALRLTQADNQGDLVRQVEGRVAALARAQTILSQRRWEGAELSLLVRGELAPFLGEGPGDGPRAVLLGPAVTVAAFAAQPISMAIHELATNAVKYGALGVPGGRVRVAWSLDRAGQVLRLVWQEQGGPPLASDPVRRGFGSRVIEQTIRSQLGGEVVREWQPEGLVCSLTLPLARRGAEPQLLAAERPLSDAAD